MEFVLREGIPIDSTHGSLYRWIDRRRQKYKDTMALIYKGDLYIYSQRKPHVFITVFSIPKKFSKQVSRLNRKKRRGWL